jgi:hypothetical protein
MVETKNCELCGHPFSRTKRRSRAQWERTRFCSRACSGRSSYQSLEDRFRSKVDRSGGLLACWIWIGSTDTKGYGQLWKEGTQAQAHRVSWELANGLILGGLFVCHHCDNPPCVNPAHLFLGTNQDNMDDMTAKGRKLL